MGSYYIYREPDYGPSTSRPAGYQTREIVRGSSHPSIPSRRPSHHSPTPSHRPISPLGTSRFERSYIAPSLTTSRIAERNAPVSISSFYSRNLDTPSRRAPPRPNLDWY
ncbi:hypothetical protein M409DRAFT_28753 [Zasmidium cellare ATCC 36951]|uniref:Uncharacterized protein n=1 Tax=Zasmidium cellare ATCC 36951 TaxID=1080233 RepID=A0A6A6C1W3_ZASCE|nr:uncharacterized protein M409DRAFT_28753 [Zasmidium cellare ATCC 36951]KAF2160873.1 hypothetical protein M409DRAFT_28753 [Zasmidium cellare ATCC 36951]